MRRRLALPLFAASLMAFATSAHAIEPPEGWETVKDKVSGDALYHSGAVSDGLCVLADSPMNSMLDTTAIENMLDSVASSSGSAIASSLGIKVGTVVTQDVFEESELDAMGRNFFVIAKEGALLGEVLAVRQKENKRVYLSGCTTTSSWDEGRHLLRQAILSDVNSEVSEELSKCEELNKWKYAMDRLRGETYQDYCAHLRSDIVEDTE